MQYSHDIQHCPSSTTKEEEQILMEKASQYQQVATVDGIDVWEAAKRGDLKRTLAIIDSGAATPNDPEILDTTTGDEGRTPLYWACFGGHVELVRELLLRGGIDVDDTCYIAVSSRQKANDERDLLFDPDTGVFSDMVDYPSESSYAPDKQDPGDDDSALIRAMLLAVKSVWSKGGHVRDVLPTQLYRSSVAESKNGSKECIVCLDAPAGAIPAPCGHIACCHRCLRSVHKRREGCPICRSRIVAIL